MYDDESGQRHRNGVLIAMNRSQPYSVAKVVSDNPSFYHWGAISNRCISIVVHTGTGKTSTTMNILCAIYIPTGALMVDRSWQPENICLRWCEQQKEVQMESIFNIIRRLIMSRILVVAPTSNEAKVIEERLLQGITVFHAYTRRLERLLAYYCRKSRYIDNWTIHCAN